MSKETLYYIVIGIVYLYFQYAKWKKANPSAPKEAPKPKKQDPIFQQKANSPSRASAKPQRKPLVVSEEKRPVYERLEDTNFTYDSPSLIRAANEKKVETVYSKDFKTTQGTPVEQRKFMYSEFVTEKKANPYAEKLKNPESIKEAFIFAEILNKKYN
jgi:hypothetical protein